jgi:hypothetical protein
VNGLFIIDTCRRVISLYHSSQNIPVITTGWWSGVGMTIHTKFNRKAWSEEANWEI